MRSSALVVRCRLVVALGLAVTALWLTEAPASGSACSRAAQLPVLGPYNKINGVAVLSSCDAWAVGWISAADGGLRTLAEHWDGKSWTRVRTPNPSGAIVSEFLGISAKSATNIWAVGSDYGTGEPELTLTEHWNGHSWRMVPSPSPGIGAGLSAVAVSSRATAWAVGTYSDSSNNNLTLILRWDGSAWTQVPSPSPGLPAGANPADSGLSGVAVASPASAWAVGAYTEPYSYLYRHRTLILHWDGHEWKQVPSPNAPVPGFNGNYLNGVSARSGNAWAVGLYGNGTGPRTLTLHWDGRQWARVASPNPSAAGLPEGLFAVAITSASSAWAAGLWTRPGHSSHTLLLRWNGRRWQQVTTPDPGRRTRYNYELVAVAGTSCENLWAVGDYSGNDASGGTVTRSITVRC